jgi:precorrin-6A/cobalt-precorrin-6A reductase
MILVLGGTTEASALGRLLAQRPDLPSVLSLAGRTRHPVSPPIPCRVGGFGGIEGLRAFLADHRVRAVIDATHPFAQRISAHAIAACGGTGTPLLVLRRPPWTAVEGDRWTEVSSAQEAAAALGVMPRRVFLSLGRLELGAFLCAPQHHYVVRCIDPPERLPPDARLILGRGPFNEEDERLLMRSEAIDVLVAKNAGGAATYAKIAVARALSLPVILMRQPPAAPGSFVTTPEEAMAWLLRRHAPHGPPSQDLGV